MRRRNRAARPAVGGPGSQPAGRRRYGARSAMTIVSGSVSRTQPTPSSIGLVEWGSEKIRSPDEALGEPAPVPAPEVGVVLGPALVGRAAGPRSRDRRRPRRRRPARPRTGSTAPKRTSAQHALGVVDCEPSRVAAAHRESRRRPPGRCRSRREPRRRRRRTPCPRRRRSPRAGRSGRCRGRRR